MPGHIAKHPPRNVSLSPNQQWENCCARCGSSMDYERCDSCEDGFDGHDCGEDTCCCLRPEENVVCDICRGEGGWHRCLSSPEWCQANPLPERENVKRGAIEWFAVEIRA